MNHYVTFEKTQFEINISSVYYELQQSLVPLGLKKIKENKDFTKSLDAVNGAIYKLRNLFPENSSFLGKIEPLEEADIIKIAKQDYCIND
jgi:hypothetical protein